jgi:hypothetical protein
MLSSGFPSSTEATSVEMICEQFNGPGWELASTPEIRHPAGAAHVRIRADLVWRERTILGFQLPCTTTVMDPDGAELGQVTHGRSAPTGRPEDQPPFHDQLDVIVDVPAGSTPAKVSFVCVVPSPPTHAPAEPDEVEEPEQGEPTPRVPAAEPPNGPRALIATGTFQGAEWGELDGAEWWLEAWQVEGYRCWSFTMVDRGGSGRACTAAEGAAAGNEYIGSSGSTPGQSYEADRTIIYGELREEVSYIEIELSSDQTYRIDALVPDPAFGIDARYYVAFVEPAEGYSVSAYDEDGNLLEDRNLNR